MHGLDDARRLRGVSEHLPELGQGTSQGVVRHDNVPPYRRMQLVLRDQDARTFRQVAQQSPGLRAQCHGLIAAPQAPRTQVEMIGRKLDHLLDSSQLLLDEAGPEPLLWRRERLFLADAREAVHEDGDDARPPGLMAGPETGSVISMEVLVEEDEVAPVRVLLELLGATVDRAAPAPVPEEDAGEPPRYLLGHLEERHPDAGAGRALDSEVVAVEPVELNEPADDEAVDGHPHRPAPVGVPPEHARVRLGGKIGDVVSLAAEVEDERVVLTGERERPDAVRALELLLVEQVAEYPLEPLLRDGGEQPAFGIADIAVSRRGDLRHHLGMTLAEQPDQLPQPGVPH